MAEQRSKRQFAFVVPSLSEASTQDEDVVQLLVHAAVRLQQMLAATGKWGFEATIVSIEPDTSGWKHHASYFSKEVLSHVSTEELQPPATPNQAFASQRAAYNLFEFLKRRAFQEVHCLDHHGPAFYATQAKRLGLYGLNTVFAVHVVGGTVFRCQAEGQLLDDVVVLMDDLLERGSVERADAVFVHDRKAWRWYEGKVELDGEARVYDLAWAQGAAVATKPTTVEPGATPALFYYGPLGADGGLPLFCDAVSRALPGIERPAEVFFVGRPKAIGGMDAVSYIRLRSAKWGVPVTIVRDLTIWDELAFIGRHYGVVYCNTLRREGLRARLVAQSGLHVVEVRQVQTVRQEQWVTVCPPVPGPIAGAFGAALSGAITGRPRPQGGLADLWQAGRPSLVDLDGIPPSPGLQVVHKDGPKVSVCLTHYNRPHMLRRALASLERQTYENFEVIVVDDGSPDPEVRRELEQIRQEIGPLGWRLLVQENRYLGAARNFGARHATGDYLLFMDDDNVAKPDEISTLVSVARRANAGIVTAFCDVFETEDTLEGEAPPPMRFTPFGPDLALGIVSNCFGDANALYSRKVFEQLGGFTEDYGITHEDWELFCRASLEGVTMVCVPEPLFWYRVHPGSMYRGIRTQLQKGANLGRHIRPYLEKLPYDQAKLVQLTQGLTSRLPETPSSPRILEIPSTVGASTREAASKIRAPQRPALPYARVAVIMRTKDRPLLLRRAVQSVLDQTFKDWLLVIVNDGGNPESVGLVLDGVEEEFVGRILVLHHPVSLGMQNASNAGVASCDSDFITIHDDDDSWEPTFLARTVSHLDDRGWDPKLGGVVTWSKVIVEEICGEGEVREHNRFIFNDRLYGISLRDLSVENRFPPISFLFRRAALDAVGPFDEQHGVLGDWDFHLRFVQRYDVDVITESLANYHHRTSTTQGAYGNTVHAQSVQHRMKRVDLLNSALREGRDGRMWEAQAQLLALGDLQSTLLDEQAREFQRLHDYLWRIEQGVKHGIGGMGASTDDSRGRNLVSNGDFRLWPGLGKLNQGPGGQYAFLEICPGFLLNYDGRHVSYRIEQRRGTEDDHRLPFRKTYLHIEKDGVLNGERWFVLECVLPSALLLSGRQVCISGLSRLIGSQDRIFVGGRYILGDNRELVWDDQRVSVPSDFGRWSCSIRCPTIEEAEIGSGHQSRVILKLPHDRPFQFDLTNFQVEFGTTPTDFEYNGPHPVGRRSTTPWGVARTWLRRARAALRAAGG